MKQVIFIGGTSYSGSTLLDMILAHDPKGFSCGEVRALFHPWRPHHVNPECGCGEETCDVWRQVLQHGEDALYETIFDRFDADFIVDSSKDLFWMKRQTETLRRKNIDVEHILIWKTPLELAYSFKKRGRLKEWKKSWINYQRAYFALISKYRAIKYSDLTTNESTLEALCDYLEIPHFPDKSQYWLKTHHTLFGNTAAKIHLYSQDSEKFVKDKNELITTSAENDWNASENYRSVYYHMIEDRSLIDFVDRKTHYNSYFEKIEQVLTSKGQDGKPELEVEFRQVKMPLIQLQFKKMRSLLFHSFLAPLKLNLSRNGLRDV